MDNNPNNGRGKNVIGKTGSFGKTGSGLGTGKPVGKDVSYSKRPQGGHSSSQGGYSGSHTGPSRAATRGMGLGGIIIVVVLAFLLFNGKSCSILNLLGGGGGEGDLGCARGHFQRA